MPEPSRMAGRDADDAFGSRGGHVAQPLAEHLRVGGAGGLFLEDGAADRIERTRAMPLDRILLRRVVTLALPGDHVQQLRPFEVAHVAQVRDQRLDVVAVDRPDEIEAELFEQRAGQHHALHHFFGAARELPHGGHLLEDLLAARPQRGIHAARQHLGEVVGQRADVLGDRHVVVVEHHQQVGLARAGIEQRFPGHAGGHRAVADDRDHLAVVLGELRGHRHAERGADRGARVADAEGVVFAFGARRERREPAALLDGVELVAPAGEHLVRIGLVADVPHQPVARRFENVVQGDGELDRAEPRGEMSAARGDALDQVVAQLVADFAEPVFGMCAQICR